MACTFNGGSGGWKILSCWRLSTPSGNVLMTCCAFQLRPHVVVTRTRFGPFDDELFDDDDDDDEAGEVEDQDQFQLRPHLEGRSGQQVGITRRHHR